jgi:hypothetical protein
VLSPGPAFVLGCLLLAAAVIAVIAGSVIAAIVLLAIAVVAFVFFYEAARRNPDDRVARSVASSGNHLRGWVRLAAASVAAWTRAARDVFRLRRESRSLRRDREPTLRLLGDAVYREDEPLVQTLLERIREIDGELERRRKRARRRSRPRDATSTTSAVRPAPRSASPWIRPPRTPKSKRRATS